MKEKRKAYSILLDSFNSAPLEVNSLEPQELPLWKGSIIPHEHITDFPSEEETEWGVIE